MWLLLAALVALTGAMAALGHFFLPHWAVLTGFSLLPAGLLLLNERGYDAKQSFRKKLASAEGRLQAVQSEQAKGARSTRELGEAYTQARTQLQQVKAENTDLQHQLNMATNRIEGMKMQELITAQLRLSLADTEKARSAADRELSSAKAKAAELTSELSKLRFEAAGLRPLVARVDGLERQCGELRQRVRSAEDFARTRENWVPFAISDEDFAGAVARVFK